MNGARGRHAAGNRRDNPLWNVFPALMIAALAISGFFLGHQVPEFMGMDLPSWLSRSLALVSITATVISIGYINSNCFIFTSDSRLLYIPYLLAVLSLPETLYMTKYHLAGLLLVWSIYYTVNYINNEPHRIRYPFMAGLTVSCAAIFVPPLVYMAALLLIYIIYRRSQDVFRMLLAFFAACLVPWIYVISVNYMLDAHSLADFMAVYAHDLLPSMPCFSELSIVETVLFVFAALLLLRSVIFVLMRSAEKNKAQNNAFRLSVALSVFIVLLVFFYFEDIRPAAVCLVVPPASFVVFDYLSKGNFTEARIFVVLMLVLAAVARITAFFPDTLSVLL